MAAETFDEMYIHLREDPVLAAFFDEFKTTHHITSFDKFVANIPYIIDKRGKFTAENLECELTNVRIEKPVGTLLDGSQYAILPEEMLLPRAGTYSSKIYCDVKVVDNGSTHTYRNIHIGTIPVMVGSCLCNRREQIASDENYFIINGRKKIIVSQERLVFNNAYLYANRKMKPTWSKYYVVRSTATMTTNATTTEIGVMDSTGIISMLLPRMSDKKPVPFVLVYKALGYENDLEIVKLILTQQDLEDPDRRMLNALMPTMEYSYPCRTKQQALDFIRSCTDTKPLEMEQVVKLVNEEMFPHIPKVSIKVFYLSHIIRNLLFARVSDLPPDNRDTYANKRLDTPGKLLENLFYLSIRQIFYRFGYSLEKDRAKGKPFSINHIQTPHMFKLFTSSIGTSNWGDRKTRTGISQKLEEENSLVKRSYYYKIGSNLGSFRNLTEPRQLHLSCRGVICPGDTPEGDKCGFVKQLAICARITNDEDPEALIELLEINEHIEEINAETIHATKIIVNGVWVGATRYAKEIYAEFIAMRRCGEIAYDTTIFINSHTNELHFYTDSGRLIYPTLIVYDGETRFNEEMRQKLLNHEMTFRDMINTGVIEFVSPQEMDTELFVVAEDYRSFVLMPKEVRSMYSHCDFNPLVIFGFSVSISPFNNHQPTPRSTYQASMGKQAAAGFKVGDLENMYDKQRKLLYAQRPLATTQTLEMKIPDEGFGVNCNVVVRSDSYGQEDAVVLNERAVQFGMFMIAVYEVWNVVMERTMTTELPKRETCSHIKSGSRDHLNVEEYTTMMRDIKAAPKNVILTRSRFTKIPYGVAKIGSLVNPGDILVSLVSIEHAEDKSEIKRDTSLVYAGSIPALVDSIEFGYNNDGKMFICVRTCQTRTPIVGDKFASRYGQKGTCGRVAPVQDLPWNADPRAAPYPDILLNPLAIPSRMTIGALLEILLGTYALQHAYRHYDATAFKQQYTPELLKQIADKMEIPYSESQWYDGMTGEPFSGLLFSGPTYYQRLKHMAADKIYASEMTRNPYTRQLAEGRKNNGGLCFGEMEKDAAVCGGLARMLRERTMEMSDLYQCYVCGVCGLVANSDSSCSACKSTDVRLVELPYGIKLTSQLLGGAGVAMRILT